MGILVSTKIFLARCCRSALPIAAALIISVSPFSSGCINPLSEPSRVDQGFGAGVKWDSTQSSVAIGTSNVVSSIPTKITLTPLNQAGEIYDGPLDVSFGIQGGSGSGQLGPVIHNPDGTYSVEFTPLAAGTVDKVYAIVN